jgi:hypothetical protein
MAQKTDILIARVSAVIVVDGKKYIIRRGKTTAHYGHPVVRGNEHMFRSLSVDYPVVEEKKAEPKKDAAPTPVKKAPGRPPKKAVEPVADAPKEDDKPDEKDDAGSGDDSEAK